MAATVPSVLALLLALVATPGLGTLGPLIGTAALFELRVSLKEHVSEMMHAQTKVGRWDQRNGSDRDKQKSEPKILLSSLTRLQTLSSRWASCERSWAILTISSASVCARIFSENPILPSAKLPSATRRMVERMARYFMTDANEERGELREMQ